MPKGVGVAAIVAAVAIVAAISGALIFFDKEPTSPDSGDEIDLNQEYHESELAGPDSGEEEDNQGPDSGDEIDTSNERGGPDSGEEEDNQGPDSGDEIDINEPTSPDSGDEITLNEDLKNRAKGSCNAISEGSTCIEYIGSYWTAAAAKINCGKNFSTKPCPRPAIGGCRMSANTSNEIVTWHYSYGGDPYTEVKQYAASACKALPGGQWVE